MPLAFPVIPGNVRDYSRKLGVDIWPRFKRVRLVLTASYTVTDSSGATSGSGSCSGETVPSRWRVPTAGEEIGSFGPGTALRPNGGGAYTWKEPLGMFAGELVGSLLAPGSSTSEDWVIRPGIKLTIDPAVTTSPATGHQEPMRGSADARTVAITDDSAVGLYYGPAAFTGATSGSDASSTWSRYWTPAAPVVVPISALPGASYTLTTVGGYTINSHPPGGASSTQEGVYSLELVVTFE